MQTDKHVKRVICGRKKTIRRAGSFKRRFLLLCPRFILSAEPPGTLSFFTSKQTLQSTLVVTTEIEHITASFLSEGIRDEQTGDNLEMQTSIFNKPEYINVGLEFGQHTTKKVLICVHCQLIPKATPFLSARSRIWKDAYTVI